MLMRKNSNLFLAGVIMLAGVLAASCQREPMNVNPLYNPDTDEVTSSFVFNISTDQQATKSAATTVQAAGGNFRGMDDAILIAYKTSAKYFVDATAAGAAAEKRFDFPHLLTESQVDDSGSKSHRVLEIGLPVGTDAMLFYGHAPKSGTMTDAEGGKITYSTAGDQASAFTFSLNPRVSDALVPRFTQTADLIAFILTRIILVDASYTVDATKYPSWTGAATISKSWRELGADYACNLDELPGNDVTLTPLEEGVGSAYQKLTSIAAGEYRAGSGDAVIATIGDLLSTMDASISAIPTSPEEELARNIAIAVKTRITNYFSASTEGVVTAFNSLDNIKNIIVTDYQLMDEATWNTRFGNVVSNDLNDFPVTTFAIPRGAALLSFVAPAAPATPYFEYKTTSNSLLNSSASAGPQDYQFPAELMYYANSSLRTSNTEKKESEYPNGKGNWDNDSWGSDWSAVNSTVTSETRAAALAQNVNYGVAMLESTAGIKSGVTALQDNRKHFYPSEDNASIAPANLNLTLTGILIGGQPQTANWQYLPTGTTFDKVIYDNNLAGTAAGVAIPTTAGSETAENYTLVLDNYNSTGTQNTDVRVALEFKNNGDSFWGKNNLIRKDGTFYLVGKLTLANGTGTIAWDNKYQVPPYTAAGVSQQVVRIFIQDYSTIAKFWLTETSLQNAYVSVPDLRSSLLSLGLSVDIAWRTGLTFNSDLGGND